MDMSYSMMWVQEGILVLTSTRFNMAHRRRSALQTHLAGSVQYFHFVFQTVEDQIPLVAVLDRRVVGGFEAAVNELTN